MSDTPPESEEIDLSPSKETYDAVKSDVTPISAIKELIDNAIDNWERVYHKNKDLKIDIEYNLDEDIFSIEDNGGGLEEENIDKLFSLGETTKSEIDTPIGAYGVGAKKAIVKIGETAELISRYKDQEYGFGYAIDRSWLEDPDQWEVTKKPYSDIDKGKTKIEIKDLQIDFDEVIQENSEHADEESSFSQQDFFQIVKTELSETYEEFLKPDETFNGDLIINFNGEKIKPPGDLDWSFTPFDGFHPRNYRDITLEHHNLDEPVYLDIKVGLTREGSQDNAGTDIFCQNRKVISNNNGVVGGYGRDDLKVGDLSATNSRLRVRLYFRTEGNAEILPWDTQKNGIDQYDSLMQEAYGWFEKIVYPYWQASSYQKMPQHFLKPYWANAEHAANNGAIQRFSYENRTRLSDRPNSEFDDVNNLKEIIDDHLDLGIFAPNQIVPRFRPAYIDAFEHEEQNVVELTDIPSTINGSELRKWLQEIRRLAQKDAENGIQRRTGTWWQPFYDSILENKLEENQSVETIEISDQEEIEGLINMEESSEGGSDSGGFQQTQFSHTSQSGGEKLDDSGDSESDDSKSSSQSQASDQAQTIDSTLEENGDKEESAASTSSTGGHATKEQQTKTESPKSTRNSQGPDDPTGHKEVEGGKPPATLHFSPDTRRKICDYLNLPEGVDKATFDKKLKEAIIEEFVEE